MLKCFLSLVVAFTCVAFVDAPQAEARFGSRYASRAGWRPGKVLLAIRHKNADRRQARRAEGRGLLPGFVARRRMAAGSCGTQAALGGCPSCPSTTTSTTTTVTSCPECPNGVCPIQK